MEFIWFDIFVIISISIFVGYSKLKQSLETNCNDTVKPRAGRIRVFIRFSAGISVHNWATWVQTCSQRCRSPAG